MARRSALQCFRCWPDLGRNNMALMNEMAQPPRVLVVDDDSAIREGLVEVFQRAGFAASSASDVPSMEKVLNTKGADVIVLDIINRKSVV